MVKTAGHSYVPPQRTGLRKTVLKKVRKDVDRRLVAAGVLDVVEENPEPGAEHEAGADNAFSSTHMYGRALCSDGWTSTSRRPLLNVVLVTAKGAYFVKTMVCI